MKKIAFISFALAKVSRRLLPSLTSGCARPSSRIGISCFHLIGHPSLQMAGLVKASFSRSRMPCRSCGFHDLILGTALRNESPMATRARPSVAHRAVRAADQTGWVFPFAGNDLKKAAGCM